MTTIITCQEFEVAFIREISTHATAYCIVIYGLLTKCEVKMAGHWPSSFLRVYGPRRSRVS